MNTKSTPHLIILAEEMAKYYFKGFGNSIDGTITDMEAFLHFRENNNADKYKNRFEYNIVHLLLHYETIPFQTLKGKPVFKPLFAANELLLKYYCIANLFFDSPEDRTYNRLRLIGNEIVKEGRKYHDNLTTVLQTIRNDPVHKDFTVKVFDDKGEIWDI
jgi:hypothetical protein